MKYNNFFISKRSIKRTFPYEKKAFVFNKYFNSRRAYLFFFFNIKMHMNMFSFRKSPLRLYFSDICSHLLRLWSSRHIYFWFVYARPLFVLTRLMSSEERTAWTLLSGVRSHRSNFTMQIFKLMCDSTCLYITTSCEGPAQPEPER